MDRLHTGPARAEEALPGFRVEIVEGSVVASPVTPHHGRTIRDVWKCLEGQIGQAWALISGVGVPFDDENEFCRDHEVKPRWYASLGIANYVVLDPLVGHCVTMWNPGPDSYRGRDTVPTAPG